MLKNVFWWPLPIRGAWTSYAVEVHHRKKGAFSSNDFSGWHGFCIVKLGLNKIKSLVEILHDFLIMSNFAPKLLVPSRLWGDISDPTDMCKEGYLMGFAFTHPLDNNSLAEWGRWVPFFYSYIAYPLILRACSHTMSIDSIVKLTNQLEKKKQLIFIIHIL